MIEIRNIKKRYGSHVAVDDLSFTIDGGSIYGLLGPNGAGKSTTMNIIAGCLAATEGSVKIGGLDIFEDAFEAKKMIGYLPEQPPLYQDMTPQEYLDFVAKAKRIPAEKRTEQIERVVEITQLAPVRARLIRNLSKGYKQRVGIAQALLGDPQVIILDEPTVGLDPKQIIEIRDMIRELGREHTVILSSHILSEVQAVCDHILIIAHGKLVAADTPENLEKLFVGTAIIEAKVIGGKETAQKALEGVAGIASVTAEQDGEGGTDITVTAENGRDIRAEVSAALNTAGLAVIGMGLKKANLEEIFLELTEKEPKQVKTEEATQSLAEEEETHESNI